jgi:MFS family permease
MGITLTMVLASFGGGLFGAALGALPAFIFCGFVVLAGEALAIAGGGGALTGAVGFGMMFGPHIAFAGGAAATAYAAKKGKLDDGANILKPLMGITENWDIMLVGGLFGILGMIVNQFLVSISTPTDTIALTVIVSALVHRVMFGETGIFGTYDPDKSDSFWNPPADIAWLPWQMNFSQLFMIGLGVGLVGGYVALETSVLVPFGIAAASLIILETKGEGPVTHHIAFPAAAAAVATGSIIWAGIFGLLGAFLGEFYARVFYDWGDTHIDPPAATIATLITAAILFLGY